MALGKGMAHRSNNPASKQPASHRHSCILDPTDCSSPGISTKSYVETAAHLLGPPYPPDFLWKQKKGEILSSIFGLLSKSREAEKKVEKVPNKMLCAFWGSQGLYLLVPLENKN